MSVSVNDSSEMVQLKKIVNGIQDGEMQLELVKHFEVSKSFNRFDILTKLTELLPLASSVITIKSIVTLFSRKIVTLLDELSILENAELSQEVLKYLKNFWSLCSSQQNAISRVQLFGKWDPLLLESITPLASVFVDLFISAYGHKENQSLFGKKLYSWLACDLSDQAIKVALLEVSGHQRKEAVIAGPLVSQVLQRQFDEGSNADYLLHFLLLKKWQGLKAVSDLVSTSRSLKAPPTFLDWLKTFWSNGSMYIPVDKSLKGVVVSQFLLDLDTEEVLESLIDALQMAVFPESLENGANGEKVVSDDILFTVDKKGVEKVKSKRKRNESEDANSPKKTTEVEKAKDSNGIEEVVSSPKKKKRRTESEQTRNDHGDVFGFTVDKGQAKSEPLKTVVEVSDHEEDEGGKWDQSDNEIMDVSSNGDNDDDSDVSSDVIELNPESSKIEEKTENMATAVLKRKNILISDPVSSSYFSGGKPEKAASQIHVFDISEEDDRELNKESAEKQQKSPMKNKKGQNDKVTCLKSTGSNSPLKQNGSQSPQKLRAVLKGSPKLVDVIESRHQSKPSPHKKPERDTVVDVTDDDSIAQTVQTGPAVTSAVNYVTIDDSEMESSGQVTPFEGLNKKGEKSFEDDIALKLSELRKSTPSSAHIKSRSAKTPQKEKETPTRRSTRLRQLSDNKIETKSPRKSSTSSSLLKDWMRTPLDKCPTKEFSQSDNKQPSSPTKHSMTKIKTHGLNESESNFSTHSDGVEGSQMENVEETEQSSPKLETSLGNSLKKSKLTSSPLKTHPRNERPRSVKKLKEKDDINLKDSNNMEEDDHISLESDQDSSEALTYLLRQPKKSEPSTSTAVVSNAKTTQSVNTPKPKDASKVISEEVSSKLTPSRRKSTPVTPKIAGNQSKDDDQSQTPSPRKRRKSLRSAKQ